METASTTGCRQPRLRDRRVRRQRDRRARRCEVSARDHDEDEANRLAFNLMHEVVQGAKTMEQARDYYATDCCNASNNDPTPCMERLYSRPSGTRPSERAPSDEERVEGPCTQARGRADHGAALHRQVRRSCRDTHQMPLGVRQRSLETPRRSTRVRRPTARCATSPATSQARDSKRCRSVTTSASRRSERWLRKWTAGSITGRTSAPMVFSAGSSSSVTTQRRAQPTTGMSPRPR